VVCLLHPAAGCMVAVGRVVVAAWTVVVGHQVAEVVLLACTLVPSSFFLRQPFAS
jgi:hypothetical protein